MRIDAYNAVNSIYQINKASSVKKANQVSKSSDKFEISEAAKSYQTAKEAVKNAPDVREDKIALIKSQLAAGTYSISSSDIADKILENAETLAF